VSNIALSSSEDVAAVGITWLATQHPWAAASITLALLLVTVLMMRWVIKALRELWWKVRPAPAQ
jgi:isoprenylcysteine carboxyl methyltransferase (ICMT) family protein YpbQ